MLLLRIDAIKGRGRAEIASTQHIARPISFQCAVPRSLSADTSEVSTKEML
jgi:hypothetical protein